MQRLAQKDWKTINDALASFQADHGTEVPSDDEYESWERRGDEIEATRLKDLERIRRDSA